MTKQKSRSMIQNFNTEFDKENINIIKSNDINKKNNN
jgi:hypothetical protein